MVYGTVTADKLGIYMFGEVLMFTSEYQSLQRMITSLKALN